MTTTYLQHNVAHQHADMAFRMGDPLQALEFLRRAQNSDNPHAVGAASSIRTAIRICAVRASLEN